MKGKKTTFEKLMPVPFEVEIGGKIYHLKRLSNRALFRLVSMLSKVMTLTDWSKLLSTVDKTENSEEGNREVNMVFLASLIAGVPLCEADFNEFLRSMLEDDSGAHPSMEAVAEAPVDVVLNVMEKLVEQEDMGGLIRRFFAIGTNVLKLKETDGQLS